ncbi:hypothetical protein [Nocardia sp. NPDC046763]|uniref:hypothetical protein n=1 Tax=Nocardia sp. NPDC046763 TaxID=3155256 RepID=UPI0033F787B7
MAGADVLHAATISPLVLQSGQLGTTADATIYTAAASTSVKITTAVVCNTTGSAATVSVGVCKAGQTAGAANRVVSGYSLAAGDSLSLSAYLNGAMLGPGDFITAYAGTASAVNLIITGIVNA